MYFCSAGFNNEKEDRECEIMTVCFPRRNCSSISIRRRLSQHISHGCFPREETSDQRKWIARSRLPGKNKLNKREMFQACMEPLFVVLHGFILKLPVNSRVT